MKSRTIRLVVILILLASAGIIATQVYWVRKAFELNEQRFNLNVNAALRNVAYSVMRQNGNVDPKFNPIEQVSPDCFIVQTNTYVDKAVLQDQLVSAFTSQNLLTDFQFGLSDGNRSKNLEYSSYYRMVGSNSTELPKHVMPIPKLNRGDHYFGVCFPNRKRYLMSQLNIWAASSFVLLCVIGLLCYLLLIIFRQRQLSEIQKDFVSNMTHEFKTPLASIRLSADVLKSPSILQQPQRLLNYATIIANEAAGLTGQVDRVLQMTHAEREGLQLQKGAFVWQEILRDELTNYAKIATTKNGVVSLQLPNVPIHYTGDVVHLKNALHNLIDNAVKYCNTQPEIQIMLQQDKRSIVVKVKDNGLGIDKAQQRMLFDKFFRVPTGNVHDVKGFGIGLNYVKLIAHAHGGDISCDSELGKGSIFTLTLPQT
jgi:two-component system phosphate regulon sensor histidine kinase PhoR